MNLQENIRTILREETETQINTVKQSLQKMVGEDGVGVASEFVGGINNLINLLYGGDLKNLYQETDYVPYKITNDGLVMYIDDVLVNNLGFKDGYGGKKLLGDFGYGSKGGIRYKFTAKVEGPFMSNNGQRLWKVIGTSGDSGFGYSFITKRNTLGKRHRNQIYDQIIDRFNLNQYL